jgi:hypothetical protein
VTLVLFPVFCENAMLEAMQAHKAVALKEHRRQDCARRHCRSYRGPPLQRQRFPACGRLQTRVRRGAVKLLARLNFLHSTVKPGLAWDI